ncbi:MAG: lamin tail domain-containing protein [Kofleriaceae bacterium]
MLNFARGTLFTLSLLAAITACGCLATGEDSPDPGGPAGELPTLVGTRLRLMAGNLTTAGQSYTNGEGIRIFQGTKPDIAMVQEFRYGANTAADMRTFVDRAFGPEFSFYRGGSGNIPNGVVSRYPILSSGDWVDSRVADRQFTWARIDIPGTTDLWAVSVHLLTSSAANRNAEAQQIVSLINANVPAGDWVVIAGDFNTRSRTEAAVSTLSSVVETSGPYPADRNGNTNTNASRARPYDWVLVSSGLHALSTPTVIGASVFANGLVADTRVYSPISEISPALVGDSGATEMQHMGVVRDFDLPTAPSASVHVDSPNGGEQWTVGTSHVISWTSSNLASVDVDYAVDGVSYTRIATGVTGGSFAWTVPAPATTAARIRVSGGTVSDTSDAAFSVVATQPPPPPPPTGKVFLNEILANEPGSSTAGEFIEIFNGTSATVDLSGWRLSDAASTRHTFAAGTTLAPGARLTVFGGASGIPAGVTAIAASTGQLNLSNSGDTVKLANSAGTAIDSFTYTSALSGTDGVSMNRSPDASTGPFVLHTTLSTASSSPNRAP